MMIKRFNNFFENKGSVNKQQLRFYAFDWDDNILNMTTVIHMEHLINGIWIKEDISTSKFAEVRTDSNWKILNDNPDLAFSEFRDNGPRGEIAFKEDVIDAIKVKQFGPAWDDFIECLTSGAIFAIITARGHESPSIKLGIEYILDNFLTDSQLYEMYNNLLKFSYLFNDDKKYDRILKGNPTSNPLVKLYLDNCDFVGVSAPSRSGDSSNPEKAKEIALLEFNKKVDNFARSLGVKALVGFSDDDLKNVKHVEDLIDNIHHEQFPNIIRMVVKGTKDPLNITKKVRTFSEYSENVNPMQSSTITMTQPNVASNTMGGARPYLDRLVDQSKFLTKLSKELFSKHYKNKKKDKKKKF